MSGRDQALHQESFYDHTIDYRHGSPHLSHWWLYDRLVGMTRDLLRDLASAGLPLRVLEIGAGHGGFTEPVLAAGCELTAVEASQPSIDELNRRYASNPNFHAVLDQDGSVDVGDGFSLILMVSVLHHIPDYIDFLDKVTRRLAPGGALFTLQDPLWYSRVSKATLALNRGAFYGWRLGQGDLGRAAATFSRRLRGVFDEENPSDTVEYHTVRNGVDEMAIAELLRSRFERVDILPYWSHQSSAAQRLGERLGAVNTFGICAINYGDAVPDGNHSQ